MATPIKCVRMTAVLLLAVVVSACAGPMVQPSVSKNYQLVEWQPRHGSMAELLRHDADDALAAYMAGKERLATSNVPAVRNWRNGVEALRDKSPLEQLDGVNRLVNDSVKYESDYEHWRRLDRWGHSYETLTEGGDCEDFAILKAISLYNLGWPAEKLAVLVGYSWITLPPGGHAILMATMADGSQVLLGSAMRELSTPAENQSYYPAYALTLHKIYKVQPLLGHAVPPNIQDSAMFAKAGDHRFWGLAEDISLTAGQGPADASTKSTTPPDSAQGNRPPAGR